MTLAACICNLSLSLRLTTVQERWTNRVRGLYTELVLHTLFHRRTRTAYVYNGCLAWYNVVLTPRIRSSMKYTQLGPTSGRSATSQHAHYTCARNRNDKRLAYTPNDCIAPDIRCIQLVSYQQRRPIASTASLAVAIRYASVSLLSSLKL